MDPEGARPTAVAHGKLEHEGLTATQLVHEDESKVGQRPVLDVEGVTESVVNQFSHCQRLAGPRG